MNPARHQTRSGVRDLMRAQCGLVAREQAVGLGCSPSMISRLVASGEWLVVYPKVYADAALPRSWEQSLLGACLAGGQGTVASHRSAARLIGLDGCRDEIVEIASPRQIRWESVVAHRTTLQPRERTTVHRIPSTAIPRTLIDLATVVDEGPLERALDSAIREGLVSVGYLERWIGRYEGYRPPGALAVRGLLRQRPAGARATDSGLEVSLARLLRKARVPQPELQYEVWDSQGLVGRVDFAFPDHRVAIECDGYRWHHGRHRWQRDLERHNRLTGAGWTVLHVTHWDIAQRPDETVGLISRTLGIAPLL